MKQMKKILIYLFSVSVLFLSMSCESSLDSPKNYNTDDIITLSVDNNSNLITETRVHIINEPLFDNDYDLEFNQTDYITTRSTGVSGLPEEDMFKLIADIESPIKNGKLLSATSVCVNDNYAYVSYHYNEPNTSSMSSNLFEGVVEVIDISEPSNPIIISSVHCYGADFNTLVFDDTSTPGQEKLWVGATDYNIGGAVYLMNLNSGTFPTISQTIRYGIDGSNSVNGVACDGDYLYVSGGRSSGGSYVFNLPSMSIENKDLFTNAKSVLLADDMHIVLVSGENASIRIYNQIDHSLIKSFSIGSIQPVSGKSGMVVKDGLIWVAKGYGGVEAYNFDGVLIHTLSNMSDKSFSTGVSLDNDYIYVANGEGGMYICEATDGVQELEVLEVYEYDKSTNYISVGQSLIFVANGKDGLKILQRVPVGDFDVVCEYGEFGQPYCLETNSIDLCDQIKDHIDIMLPEYSDVTVKHPEYFEYSNNIVLKENATIYFSFVDEGAGKMNSFGVYTYNTETPPTTVDELDNKLLIYPNSSKKGSGGYLDPGATMKFTEQLPKGTNIGAFLIFGSWVGVDKVSGGMTEGYYTHYTDSKFNQHELQQALIFYDKECDAILYCFEDIKVTGGDKDYNDCIVRLIVEPSSAIDVSKLIPIGE